MTQKEVFLDNRKEQMGGSTTNTRGFVLKAVQQQSRGVGNYMSFLTVRRNAVKYDSFRHDKIICSLPVVGPPPPRNNSLEGINGFIFKETSSLFTPK